MHSLGGYLCTLPTCHGRFKTDILLPRGLIIIIGAARYSAHEIHHGLLSFLAGWNMTWFLTTVSQIFHCPFEGLLEICSYSSSNSKLVDYGLTFLLDVSGTKFSKYVRVRKTSYEKAG